MGLRIFDARWPVMILIVAAAMAAAACGGSGGATTTADTAVDPLTITIPPSTVDASLPVEPSIFRVIGRPSMTLGLVRAAGMRGFFGQQGLSTHIIGVPTLAAISSALKAGTVDAAVISSDEAVQLRSTGLPLKIVTLLTSGTSDEVILAKADIADVPGLAGQRVAVATGSEGELLLRGAMAENQMAPSSVQIVSSHTTGPGALLASGAVAAAALTGAQAAAAVATDPTLHPLYTAGDHPGLISHVLVVRETTTDQRPGQILAFIRGWQALYMSNRDQADVVSADIAAVMHLDPTAVAADLAGLSLYDLAANAVELLPGGEYFDQTIGVIVAAEQAAGTITEVIKGQELIDGSFVQAVASAR